MPRVARKKSAECMYHVMNRSISEVELFRSCEDKDHYIKLLKRYKEKYKCMIYAYCLMSNHVHIFINPQGFDISSFMHSLNTAYVTYFNKRYNRHGHLFQGRFASKIVNNDTYSVTLSAYIHNNCKDIPEYAGKEETYRYSSYGIYTGHRKDTEGIVDTGFLLDMFDEDTKIAIEKFKYFTGSLKETGILAEVDENIIRAYTENVYVSCKQNITRCNKPEELIIKVSKALGSSLLERLRAKYCRETSKDRAFITYIFRSLCGYTYSQICLYIGNMSVSGITRLVNEGFRLVMQQRKYNEIFNFLIYAK